MFKIIAISNRRLCKGDFCERLRAITATGIDVILREKDLSGEEYSVLLRKAGNVIPHSFVNTAKKQGYDRIHLPLFMLREEPQTAKEMNVGVSVHSSEEAREAQGLGAKYVIAGHVFETDCKKGLKGRGLDYIRDVKSSVNIPVYAIGGISAENIALVRDAGADGACIMSGFMSCNDIKKYKKEIEDVLYRN